ncbi:probable cell division protein kinase ECU11_1290 [Sander lucioperca]|uniref:probable cell division protein kinase ECU11_1290 n=1 Tax=Sander lucioperca TaxID=283035 RepID=UPI0016537538|nr:probable cell division protein kinase ECU11_1290 [Sander lucioperca]
MEKYLTGTVIGQGAYGTVYKATCQKTGKEFALKCHKRGVEEATVRELSCLTALQGHPYVIQIHECVIHNGMMATLMSYAPYTLSNVIHSGHLLCHEQVRALEIIPLSFVARFSVQVAEALSYMHRLNLVHRDLTPFNVLLTEDLTVQVADMGLSRHSCKWMSTPVVTEAYRAPELFVEGGISEYTCAIDMWSLGVMIVDAMEGRVAFASTGVSPYQIIVRTLCPKDHPDALRANERLLAHELLKDTEWTEAAHMTKEDKDLVRDLVRDRIDRRRVEVRINKQ